jgi:hypothetical protein
MRTTLDIDQDVLEAAKELALRENSTAGKVLSRLARSAFLNNGSNPRASTASIAKEPETVYGFTPFASRGGVVSSETIDRIRDEEGI